MIRVNDDDALFLELPRKASNETPVQFNECHVLMLKYILRASNLVHLMTKQVYGKINVVV